MASFRINQILLTDFRTVLARYPDTAPSTLADLDTLRYETIPAKLGSMKGEKHLLKADIEKLVEWKLKHGTFRPALMSLVKSNPAEVMESITQSAFSSLDSNEDVLKALKILTQLRGIGPATASLLLSVYQPDTIPFFSDELFRWSHWDASVAESGWERKIKYSVKEYQEIVESVQGLRSRLGVGATEAEKVAYVLGKEGADVERGSNEEEGVKGVVEQKVKEETEERKVQKKTDMAKPHAKVTAKEIKDEESKIKPGRIGHEDDTTASGPRLSEDTAKKGTKRKAHEQKAPTEVPRRSTRRKT